MPEPGDCALFREGGEGRVFKTPTYWLRGRIAEIRPRTHRVELCPDPGHPRERYTREDWKKLAAAWPCTTDPARVREIETIRILLRVDAWDTPWSRQHGQNGWLFRGHFLDTELKEGVVVEIDGSLLERCETNP